MKVDFECYKSVVFVHSFFAALEEIAEDLTPEESMESAVMLCELVGPEIQALAEKLQTSKIFAGNATLSVSAFFAHRCLTRALSEILRRDKISTPSHEGQDLTPFLLEAMK